MNKSSSNGIAEMVNRRRLNGLVSKYLYKISLKWRNALERDKSERQELDNVLCKNECNTFTSKKRVLWYLEPRWKSGLPEKLPEFHKATVKTPTHPYTQGLQTHAESCFC